MKNHIPKNIKKPDLVACHKGEKQKHFSNFPEHKNKNESITINYSIKT